MVTQGTPDSRRHRPSLLGLSRCCQQTGASSDRPGCSPDSGWLCTGTGTAPAKDKEVRRETLSHMPSWPSTIINLSSIMCIHFKTENIGFIGFIVSIYC